jgi:hypothetical protein
MTRGRLASARAIATVAFGQLLSFSGVTPALTKLAINLPVEPIVVLILMQVVVVFLGMLIEQTSIVMVTIRIFMPIVAVMGWDPVWFGAIMLLNLELATISPTFGLSLFVMKGIASLGTTMSDLYRAALPFVGLNFLVMGLMIGFPPLVLWLPSLMRGRCRNTAVGGGAARVDGFLAVHGWRRRAGRSHVRVPLVDLIAALSRSAAEFAQAGSPRPAGLTSRASPWTACSGYPCCHPRSG